MKIKFSFFDTALIMMCGYLAATESPWFWLAFPTRVALLFVNPRWDRENGWRFLK